MMTCKDLEYMLAAYLEDLLSPEEKRLMEKHLLSCERCSKALEDLKKTEKLLRELGEIEPPPWFTQKTMSRVREEEKRKRSIIQRLFYPLHIKIPIQALATVLIAVLAIHVYRAGEPEMKDVIRPPATVLEVRKDQILLESRKAPAPAPATVPATTPAVRSAEKKPALGDIAKKDVGDSITWRKQLPPRKESAPPIDTAMTVTEKREAVKDKIERLENAAVSDSRVKPSEYPPAPTIESKKAERIYDEGTLTGAKGAQKMAPRVLSATIKTPAHALVTVYARNVDTAAGDVEALLRTFGARNITRLHHEGKVSLIAEIEAKRMQELREKLKTIGETKETGIPSDVAEKGIVITIEVTGNR